MTYWKRPISDPIRNLTMDRLNRQIESFEAGYVADFAVTAEAMEQRDDILKNVITKRKKAITRHGWEILRTEGSSAAREQAEALEYFYRHLTCSHAVRQDECGGFSLLVYQMMDATAKGYAVHEIVWKPILLTAKNSKIPKNQSWEFSPPRHRGHREEGQNSNGSVYSSQRSPRLRGYSVTAHLKFVPLWYFEATSGKLRFLPNSSARQGEPMPPGDWLVTAGAALMIACSRAFLFKNYPLQAWLDHAINYGIPGVHGSTPAARGSADWSAMEDSLREFMKELTAVTNNAEGLEVVDLKGHGEAPFAVLVERMDRIMAALWRGADLSTLSRDRGYGASLQDLESRVLEEDDARVISDHLNVTLDRWVINALFGEREPQLARVKILVTPRDATAQDLAIDEFLIRHGARLSIEDAMERYGRAAAGAGEAALTLEDLTAKNLTAKNSEKTKNSYESKQPNKPPVQ